MELNDRIAEAVEQIGLRASIPIKDRLWGVAQIAAYLEVSESQVRQRFAPLPKFPKAIRLPTADGRTSHPRWKASEIMSWAESYQA